MRRTDSDPFIKRQPLPSQTDLEQLFLQKYGKADAVGWGPSLRRRWGYYLPADVYEALLMRLVFEGCVWLDVGGGRQVFPENPQLTRELVARCPRVVAVDPDDNVLHNTFVHERVRCRIEDYRPERLFDLATLRMVVEHVEEPQEVVGALNRLLRPGGRAVILTVNRWAPLTLLSWLTPFRLHHPLKRVFWGTEERDTFPVHYRMNTRRTLDRLFAEQRFKEEAFAYLEDLSTLGRFRLPGSVELGAWRLLRCFGVRYPENCLLGVYRKLA